MLIGLMICAMSAVPVEALKDWTIVVAPEATASEAYAAEELRGLLKQAIGAELAISRDTSVQQNAILIGSGASGEPAEKFGEEELLIRVGPERIVITGGRPRGTLYGVYEFCERYLGCEFLTFDQTYFPPVGEMEALPEEEYSYTPPFSFRWSYYKQNEDAAVLVPVELLQAERGPSRFCGAESREYGGDGGETRREDAAESDWAFVLPVD